jgi:hypothetical protein
MIGSLATGGALAASAMNPVTAGLALAQPLFQGVLAGIQGVNAKRIQRQNPRPVQGIPGSQQEALANARNMAMGLAPGTALAQNQLDRTLGGSIAAIRDSGGGQAERLAALTRLDANAGTQVQQMMAAQQQYQQQMDMNLQAQLDRQAQYEQNAWEYNQNQPYQAAQAKAAALHDAANDNAFNAIGGIGGALASGLKKARTSSGTGQQAATGLAGGAITTALGGLAGKVANPAETPATTESGDATISDPNGLVSDPSGLINGKTVEGPITRMPRYRMRTMNQIYPNYREGISERDRRGSEFLNPLEQQIIQKKAAGMDLTPIASKTFLPGFMPTGNQMGRIGNPVFGSMAPFLVPGLDRLGTIQRRK